MTEAKHRCHGLFCRYSYLCQRYLSGDDSQPFINPPTVNINGYCDQLIGHKIDHDKTQKDAHFRDMWNEGIFHMWRLGWTKQDEKLYGKLKRNNHD